MPKEQFPMKVFEEDYLCDECGIGYMRPTGFANLTSPVQYPHACNNDGCKARKTFNVQYPKIVHESVRQ